MGQPPPSGYHLNGSHVDLVQIGPLFAIHFDIHKVLVHQGGDLLVLKRLLLHDMAPVAGRIAYTKKDRLTFFPGPRKGLLPPRIPFDRIVGVLE